jgi:hypothetical protein
MGTLMLTVAISSFFIHIIRLWGPWSPIHLFVDPGPGDIAPGRSGGPASTTLDVIVTR